MKANPPPSLRLPDFIVQEHPARSPHFQLRLEHDGALKSWALPKGPVLKPHERHLAIQVEDLPLDYAHLEPGISPDEPGAGTVRLWDRGTCEVREWNDERIIVVLRGAKLHGCFALVRLHRAGPRHWLFLSLRRARLAQHAPTTARTSLLT